MQLQSSTSFQLENTVNTSSHQSTKQNVFAACSSAINALWNSGGKIVVPLSLFFAYLRGTTATPVSTHITQFNNNLTNFVAKNNDPTNYSLEHTKNTTENKPTSFLETQNFVPNMTDNNTHIEKKYGIKSEQSTTKVTDTPIKYKDIPQKKKTFRCSYLIKNSAQKLRFFSSKVIDACTKSGLNMYDQRASFYTDTPAVRKKNIDAWCKNFNIYF